MRKLFLVDLNKILIVLMTSLYTVFKSDNISWKWKKGGYNSLLQN